MSTATKPRTETRPWQDQIIEQLADTDPDTFSHAIVHLDGDQATLLDTCPSEAAAAVSAEDHSTKVGGGEVRTITATELHAGIDGDTPATDIKAAAKPEQKPDGQDVDAGKLFDVPRVKVVVDESDPNVIKLAFSGSIELDRGKADDVKFYNQLKAGKNADLSLGVFVAGPKNSHRRDSEGNVQAIVQTKSLVVHSINDVEA